MSNSEEIHIQLERIIASDTFAKTSTNIKLLRFLVNETLNGAQLKEAIIGVEMFGRMYDPIKNDNKVRVYIYHLRKKLDQYYSDEAEEGEIKFNIEKGQYAVNFSYPQKGKIRMTKKEKKVRWSTVIASVILFIAVSYIVYLNRNVNNFWSENFKNKYSSTVLIGDHFTINAPLITGGNGLIRDFQINSETDYNSFIQRNPEMISELSQSDYSYITKMGAYCSNDISLYFGRHRVNFDLMLSSEWDKSKMNDENIVYIGQIKNMRVLKNIVEKHYPIYGLGANHISRTDPVTKKKRTFNTVSNNEMVDYTLVANITGPGGNNYKFFLSDHDGGVISALRYFTDEKSINSFYRENKIGDKDFVALFKVTGWERTGYDMELEHIDFVE